MIQEDDWKFAKMVDYIEKETDPKGKKGVDRYKPIIEVKEVWISKSYITGLLGVQFVFLNKQYTHSMGITKVKRLLSLLRA